MPRAVRRSPLIYNITHLGIMITAALGLTLTVQAQVTVTIDYNGAASGSFKFNTVPTPASDDAGAKAKWLLLVGELDPNGADLNALTDGLLPTNPDEPAANLFFNAGTTGGRFRMDLGTVIEIASVNSYSWHPNSRGPQVYLLSKQMTIGATPSTAK